ncbi:MULTISPECIES: hypothetical protein [Pantoea]|uniref:hypothetical protein n=1 Tax=Pantoea TaxID=53335 RepID=UPI0018E0C0C8|nr:hypothetical protein [Pantoea agglomerans]UEG73555.1 hypothetical protein LKW31_14425 [Pantoea agglomerans]
MDSEFIRVLNLDPSHRYELLRRESEQRRGRDTDLFHYREFNEQGEEIGIFTVEDSMSIYPPQRRTIRRL